MLLRNAKSPASCWNRIRGTPTVFAVPYRQFVNLLCEADLLYYYTINQSPI
nr:MAG TPA: hypothetical protein [Caudoviricetes sp.]